MPTLRNTPYHLHEQVGMNYFVFHTYLPLNLEQSVPQRRRIKFRHRGITQKKAYNNTTELFWSGLFYSLIVGVKREIVALDYSQ